MEPEARQVALGLIVMAVTPSRWLRRSFGGHEAIRALWTAIEGSEEEAVTE